MINKVEYLIRINGNNELDYYQNQVGNKVYIKDAHTHLSRSRNRETNIVVVPDDMYSFEGIKFLIYAVINPYFKKLTTSALEQPIDNSLIFKNKTYNQVFKFLIRKNGFYRKGHYVCFRFSCIKMW